MGYLKLAQLLVEHGADVNARDDRGHTPLDWVNPAQGAQVINLLHSRKEKKRDE